MQRAGVSEAVVIGGRRESLTRLEAFQAWRRVYKVPEDALKVFAPARPVW